MPTWTITSEQVEKFTNGELKDYLDKTKKGGNKLIVKNCIVRKFTPKENNKDGEQITTITIDAINMSNPQIASLADKLGMEMDMQLAESIEDRNGQQRLPV
jgi:hypothetical protein